ncbi:MAG: 16S rRNA (guanine(966)-N(2))-methyltransferase RsmD [Clostridia bacterium]|nr:16S rRNA (guanine(966)-N(2))-methyltransferase RsmD [Clostridia bacterium]
MARGTKLSSIDSNNTRPTLDRVKESLFNIINDRIDDSVVLDLFAGSGAIGIEFLSRGCKKAYMCDKSKEALKFINENINKTKLQENAVVANKDYTDFLKDLYKINEKFDIVFLDPPYELNIAVKAVSLILEYKLLKSDGIIIIETDQKEREIKELEEMNVEIYDTRKYGRANLIFLVERG